MPPREFFEQIEDRLISGLGIIEIPQEDTWRYFRLWVNLVRFPDPDYLNNKWNPSRGEYAKVAWMWSDWVWKEDVIRYPKSVFDYPVKESASFLAPYLVCSNQALGNLTAAIAVAVGLPPPVPGDPLYVEPVKFELTRIQFSCREESAFQLILEGLKEDVGCPGAIPNPKRDLPPIPLPVVPTNSAIEVSPPYNFPDDDGNTVPYTGDPVPPPNECEDVGLWRLNYTQILPSSNEVRYIPGKESDTFAFTFNPISGCSRPAQLLCNGQVIYPQFSCQGGVQNPTFTYLGLIDPLPPSGNFANPLYPSCDGTGNPP